VTARNRPRSAAVERFLSFLRETEPRQTEPWLTLRTQSRSSQTQPKESRSR
jgi:hypothetical protein